MHNVCEAARHGSHTKPCYGDNYVSGTTYDALRNDTHKTVPEVSLNQAGGGAILNIMSAACCPFDVIALFLVQLALD